MDFATRNLYRNAIEELGRGSQAFRAGDRQRALAAAAAAHESARTRSRLPPDRATVAAKLERAHRFPRVVARLAAAASPSRSGARDYVGGHRIHLGRWCLSHRRSARCCSAGVHGGTLWLLGVLGVVPAVDIAVALINRAVTRGVSAPVAFQAWRCATAFPTELRTLVAMPVMLTLAATSVEQHLHGSRSTTSPHPTTSCISRCCRTGSTPTRNRRPSDDALLDIAVTRHRSA